MNECRLYLCTCAGIDGDVAGREALRGQTGVGHKQQGQQVVCAGDGRRDGAPAVPAHTSVRSFTHSVCTTAIRAQKLCEYLPMLVPVCTVPLS